MDISSYIESSRAEYEQKLREWVEIPTISSDPTRRGDIGRGADAAVAYLRSLGAKADAYPTRGNPVVFARFASGPNHPTVTIYNHLDVQPANEPQWLSEPFVFKNENGVYHGRGTTDDKGPALTALFAARYAVQTGIPLNIQLIWELEEEIGSPNFEEFVKNNRERLKTNSVLVSDTIWISRTRPAVAYGLRGLLGLTMTLTTGKKDVHSGVTGGVARNPIGELCALVAQCYDAKTGKVRIRGFYDDVLPASKAEVRAFLESGFSVSHFKRVNEFTSLRTTRPDDVVRRLWALPTFEVHGMVGGYTGPGVKTAIAPQAELKVSMRLVPNQNPDRILKLVRDFVKKKNPDVVIKKEGVLRSFVGPFEGPYADAARDAMKHSFGRLPAFVREGGSIGAVVTMEKYLKAPILFLGLSLPEHGYHAPNENFDWTQASGGMRMFARYFENIVNLR